MGDFSIMGFAAKLAELAIATDEVAEKSLTAAAKIVQREAKHEIGKYQGAAGPFAGWSELADSTKVDRLRQGYTENDPELRDGMMRDSIEFTVETDLAGGGEAEVGSDMEIFEFQELGTSKMPPRSILGSALVHKTDEVVTIIGASTYGALTGQQVVNAALPLIEGGDAV